MAMAGWGAIARTRYHRLTECSLAPDPNDQIWTNEEVAAYLRISDEKDPNQCQKGLIPGAFQLGIDSRLQLPCSSWSLAAVVHESNR